MKRSPLAVCAALCIVVALGIAPSAATPSPANDPVSFVDTLIGTSGNAIDGPSDTFPGADAPFGMVQWSPDTPSRPSGGGYAYGDDATTGFSLTHLSGPGCDVFGDVSILPTIGPVADPAHAQQPFKHATETASPGYYESLLGEPPIRVQLTTTTRTGLGAFSFPPAPQANILINPSSNQVGVADAHIRFVGDREVEGSATSGWFCGMPGTYTVYFVLRFNRPIASHGTWQRSALSAGAGAADGSGAGGWATFDTTSTSIVKLQAALSWVSVAGARTNLASEGTSWDVGQVRARTAQSWRDELSRIAVDGGTPTQLRVFYSALYHALLHPNVFSDADGEYRGFDGRVHQTERGHVEYATFSGWDIYRTQIPLVAFVDPSRGSDMVRSLVHAAQQMGWLPKWPLVNVESAVMGGDPSDPMIAGAYAFGARDFDTHAALAAMIKGATQSGGMLGQGWYVQRPGLQEYQTLGYVINDHATNVSPVANGASLTLEYATDDFAIAQFARALGDNATYQSMMRRAQNWSHLFDRSSALIAPRDRDAAMSLAPITEHGQDGFQEGNAAQYTWMVPQNLAGVFAGVGGNVKAAAALDTFFTKLDAGPDEPYAWLGNEPTIGSPWAYLSAGAPWKSQRVVRDAMLELWGDTPDGIPGNDDLGTMSAWYVWCALGLYPQYPSLPILDLGAPLFRYERIRVPNGPSIDIIAQAASDQHAYVRSVRRNGIRWTHSWIPVTPHERERLDFDLSNEPNPAWASAAGDAPPSFALGFAGFPASTAARLVATPDEIRVAPGATASLHLTLDNRQGTQSASARLHADIADGLRLDSLPATLGTPAGGVQGADVQVTVQAGQPAGLYDVFVLGTTSDGAQLAKATWVMRVDKSGQRPPLAYAANYFDNTVVPVDTRTLSFGAPIPAGANPRDVAVSPDGQRIFVTDQGAQAVSVIDARTRTIKSTVALAGSPWGIRLTPDGRTAWVSLTSSNAVQSFDTTTLIAAKPIPVADQPGGLAMTPDGLTLLVADLRSNDVTPVDIRRRVALDPIPVGAHPRSIVVTPNGATAYVTNSGADSVTVIDLTQMKALRDVRVGISPRGLAVSPDGKWVYVADFASDSLTPIETATQSAKPAFMVGLNPIAVLVDASNTSALVVNAGDNDCTTLDLASGRLGKRIPLGNRPIAIAR